MWTYDSIINQGRNTGWFLWRYPSYILILLHIFPVYSYNLVTSPLGEAIPSSGSFFIFKFSVSRMIDFCLLGFVFVAPFINYYYRRKLPTIVEVVLILFICGTGFASFSTGLSFFSTSLSIIWVCLSCLPPTSSGKIWPTTRTNFLSVSCLSFLKKKKLILKQTHSMQPSISGFA